MVLPCECKNHAATFMSDREFGILTVGILTGFFEENSLWQRIKLIWHILREGKALSGDVVLDKNKSAELRQFLLEFENSAP